MKEKMNLNKNNELMELKHQILQGVSERGAKLCVSVCDTSSG